MEDKCEPGIEEKVEGVPKLALDSEGRIIENDEIVEMRRTARINPDKDLDATFFVGTPLLLGGIAYLATGDAKTTAYVVGGTASVEAVWYAMYQLYRFVR